MKRIILFSLAVFDIVFHAAALDFGVSILNDTETGGSKDTVYVAQGNSLSGYIQIPTGDFSSVHLSGEARFYGFFPCKPKAKAQYLPLSQSFRITRTEWAGVTALGETGIQWAIGRTNFSDHSKKILVGLFDGARINLTLHNAEIAVAAAYTGLTYKTDAKIRIDQDDIERTSLKSKVLAPHRLFLLLSSSFPELIPSHTVGCEVLAQFDLMRQKTATHTQYLLPYIRGKIHRNVSWKLWGAVLFGEDTQFFHSGASGLLVQYFNPQWLNFTLTGTLDWAAGDYDGSGALRTFIPVTDMKHTRIAKTPFRDTLTTGLSTSIRPVQGLVTELAYTLLTKPNNRKEPVYSGSELLTALSYNFYNDIYLSFLCGLFIPNKKTASVQDVQWLADVALAFNL